MERYTPRARFDTYMNICYLIHPLIDFEQFRTVQDRPGPDQGRPGPGLDQTGIFFRGFTS